MRSLLRTLIVLIVLASLGSITYGFTILEENDTLANQCIGFGVVGLFLLAMPLFLISESQGKKLKDYMLTEENIRKMRGKEGKTSGNQ
jgi:hypothetical protein